MLNLANFNFDNLVEDNFYDLDFDIALLKNDLIMQDDFLIEKNSKLLILFRDEDGLLQVEKLGDADDLDLEGIIFWVKPDEIEKLNTINKKVDFKFLNNIKKKIFGYLI